jgi:hypothetical protein
VRPGRNIETEVRRWLLDHYGVISRDEACQLGETPPSVRRKVARGEWEKLCGGVYRAAVVLPTPQQRLRAAYLATQKIGVISHTSAAWLWGLRDDEPPTIDVTIPTGARMRSRLPSLVLHRCRDIEWACSHSHLYGLPVTNPLRTIVDVAAILPPNDLTDVVDKALARQLVSPTGLNAELERLARRGRTGVGILRRHLLERGFIGAPLPSVLEARMRRVLLIAQVPVPQPEHRAGPDGEYRLDFAWVDIMLAVEVDGYVWHHTPQHQQRDLRRRNALQSEGWTLLVYTWRDVSREPLRVVREVRGNYDRLAQAAMR